MKTNLIKKKAHNVELENIHQIFRKASNENKGVFRKYSKLDIALYALNSHIFLLPTLIDHKLCNS